MLAAWSFRVCATRADLILPTLLLFVPVPMNSWSFVLSGAGAERAKYLQFDYVVEVTRLVRHKHINDGFESTARC